MIRLVRAIALVVLAAAILLQARLPKPFHLSAGHHEEKAASADVVDESDAAATQCGKESYDAWVRSRPGPAAADKRREFVQTCQEALGLAHEMPRVDVDGKRGETEFLRAYMASTLVGSPGTNTIVSSLHRPTDEIGPYSLVLECDRQKIQHLLPF